MKKFATLFFMVPAFIGTRAQQTANYTIHIQHDTAIQWAAESDKVINLSPKVRAYSLKKWYLDKLRKGAVTAYSINEEGDGVTAYPLTLPSIGTPAWLKGLGIELPSYKNPKEWYFVDKKIPPSDYERFKYRVGALRFSRDTCCGCDDADAFRARQVLTYKKGRFTIYNVFISPLCARLTDTTLLAWYPLCNVAYNDKADRPFPGAGPAVVLLNTDEVDYEFSREYPSPFDSVLTVYRTDIGSLLYQDILSGKLKTVDYETGRHIPVSKFLTWNMPADTIPEYDESGNIAVYRVVQQERSSAELSRLRIKQDLYFDFTHERLYSVIRSVTIILAVRNYDGSVRGYRPFCRLE